MGVMAGKNDNQFRETLIQGFEQYRKIDTKRMTVRKVSISSIDNLHCVAHVAWTATYGNGENPDIAIDFDVHYLMQKNNGKPYIFGWISGDEQEALKEYGVI